MTELITPNLTKLLTPYTDKEILLKDDKQADVLISDMLMACYCIMPRYNIKAEQLPIIKQVMLEALQNIETYLVKKVFIAHIKTKSEFPTVAAIYNEIQEIKNPKGGFY